MCGNLYPTKRTHYLQSDDGIYSKNQMSNKITQKLGKKPFPN